MTTDKQVNPARRATRRSVTKADLGEADLTLREVCARLKISRSTFYEWRGKGKAPRCKKLPNGDLRIPVEWYQEWDAGLAAE